MHPSRRRALLPVLLVSGVAVLALALLLVALPAAEPVRTLLPVALALALLGAALALHRFSEREAGQLAARIAERDRDASQLRHDLRGILSPAMLTADRLTANADPVVRRAGETMVATVERAEQRLRGPSAPPGN